jgi:hypothetical protein
MFSTFMLFGLSFQNLSLKEFAMVQLTTSILGIVLWFLDFGCMTNVLLLSGKGKIQEFRRLLGVRFAIMLTMVSILIGMAAIESGNRESLLILAIFLDLYTDSLVNLRQIHENSLKAFLKLAGKKFLQLGSFFVLIHTTEFGKLNALSVSILFGSTLVFVADWLKFRPAFRFSDLRNYFREPGIWFQSGGTALASLDIFILTRFGGLDFVPIMSLGKRISSSIGILGSSLVPETLNDWNQRNDRRDLVYFRITIFSAISGISSFLAFLYRDYIALTILGRNLSSEEGLVLNCILLSIPIGVLTANLNAILISMNSLKEASWSTFTSSLVYLSILLFGMHNTHVAFVLSLGIIANISLELLVQCLFLVRNRSYIK